MGKGNMKGLKLILGTLALLFATYAPAASFSTDTTELDRIVAVVDDDVITQTELDTKLGSVEKQLRQQNIAMPGEDTLRKQVLERLILTHIQLQLAARSGIQVDDDTLNRTISTVAAQNKLTLSEFRNVLDRDGVDFAQFREEMRDEIVLRRLRQRQVDSRVTVTDQEIDNLLAAQKRQGNISDEYRIGHILIALPEAATPKQIQAAREKAQEVLSELGDGADFGKTAISFSDGQQALDGGDLGWRKAGELPTLFADVVLQLKVGEISNLIRSSSGFHIIKLLDHRGGDRHITTQTHARHILIRPNELTSEEDARRKSEEVRNRIQHGEDFAAMAEAYSDDKANSGNGGDLGWVNPGEMDPDFEAAMNALQPNQLSAPVRTRFGWHLIEVLGRRTQDVTEEFERTKARDQTYQRKVEEETMNWLRRLRDEAYVEIRPEGT